MARVLQWAIGLALIVGGFWKAKGALAAGSMFGAFFPAAIGLALIVTGAIVVAPPLAVWAATPFLRFIDSIYLPGGRLGDKPPPNHRLAEHYYRGRQFDLAAEEYRKMLANQPGEERAYIAMIDILANHQDSPARAAKLYRKGLRKIRTRDGRNALRRAYRRGDVAPLEIEEEQPTLGGFVKFPDLRA